MTNPMTNSMAASDNIAFSEPPTPAVKESITVLLVDDQAMVGEAIRRTLLDQSDIIFHFCDNPREAIAIATEIKPTIILQDLVMPDANGLDLVVQYRKDPDIGQIPIIVLSTKEEPAVKSEAFKLGANDYLVKLPDKIELIARIRYHSAAYLAQMQRDQAYHELHESQRQLMEINMELQRLTNVDGLTGLSNKKYFYEYLEAEWNRAMRGKISLSILMIDVDHFKQYNDTYGHLAGDEILKKIAETVQKSCVRAGDLVARFGGEEFITILPATPLDGVLALGQQLCREVENLHLSHKASSVGPHVTISVGGATTIPQQGGRLPAALIDTADKALYKAKGTGRNRAIARACDS